MMEAIWTDAFVEESNVSQNIYTLRRTLGVDEQGRQFIETVPRRGYRFAVPVRLLDEASNNGANGSQVLIATQAATVSPSATEKVIRPRPTLRYALFACLGIVVLFSIGFGVYQFVVRRGKTETIAPIEQIRPQRLTESGDVIHPTISPDGELLAYVRLEKKGESVWIKQIETGGFVQTLPPSRKGYRSLAFSPDSKYLFFREESDPGVIYQTPILGGESKKVAENVWSDFSVSPDGRQIAFIRRDAGRNNAHLLILSNIDGGGERELSARYAPLDYRGSAPAWSPDATKLVISGGLQQQLPTRLLTVDVATGRESELKTQIWRGWTRAVWAPNGKHLYVTFTQ
jgi:hypothetical protein